MRKIVHKPPLKEPPPLRRADPARQLRGEALARHIGADPGGLVGDYLAGEGITDLSLRYHVSWPRMRRLLLDLGVKLRPMREAYRLRTGGASWIRTPKPEPAGKRTLVRDIDGVTYFHTHTSSTLYGFDVLRGRAAGGQLNVGAARPILTRELADFLIAHRLTWRSLDLPISKPVLKALRDRLGIDKVAERRARWEAANDDLASKDPARRQSVAKLLGVTDVTVRQRRAKLGNAQELHRVPVTRKGKPLRSP